MKKLLALFLAVCAVSSLTFMTEANAKARYKKVKRTKISSKRGKRYTKTYYVKQRIN